MRRPSGGSKVWGAILGRVLRKPRLSVDRGRGFLVVLATPVVGIHTEQLGLDKLLPADASIMQSYHRITAAFPGGPNPARVVVKTADVGSPAMTAATGFRTQALATGLMRDPIVVTRTPRRAARGRRTPGRQRVGRDVDPRAGDAAG